MAGWPALTETSPEGAKGKMGMEPPGVAAIREQVGKEWVSGWVTVDQQMIDDFADTTRDWNFLHVDREKAAAAGFGGTIAHGFLSLSLLAPLRQDCGRADVEGLRAGVNFGFDRVRFIAPVASGKRIRGRFLLSAIEPRRDGQWLETMDVSIEIEGVAQPALAARWLTMYLF